MDEKIVLYTLLELATDLQKVLRLAIEYGIDAYSLGDYVDNRGHISFEAVSLSAAIETAKELGVIKDPENMSHTNVLGDRLLENEGDSK